jgi:hypothetical protein
MVSGVETNLLQIQPTVERTKTIEIRKNDKHPCDDKFIVIGWMCAHILVHSTLSA